MKQLFILLHVLLFSCCLTSFSQDFWEEVELPQSGAEVASLEFNDNGLLVLGTADNVYTSNDAGDNWTAAENWPGYKTSCIAFNANNGIFIGTQSNGIYRSTDGGLNFEEINVGLTYLNVWCIVILDNGDILIGTPVKIFRSANNGNSWSSYGTGLPEDEVLTLDVADNGNIFAGTYSSGVYRSTDQGANWNESNNGLPENADIFTMHALATGPLLIGTFPEGIFKTYDYGDNWEAYNQGLPIGFKYSNLLAGAPNKISSFSIGFAYEIQENVSLFFVGFYFRHTFDDGSKSIWMEQNDGLPEEPTFTSMAVSPDKDAVSSANDILVGTFNQGLYRNALPVGIRKSIIESGISLKNYPNPFSDLTTIKFHPPENQHIRIEIFDPLGRLVDVIFDDIPGKGNQTVVWNPENLKGGIYYCRMKAGEQNFTNILFYNK